MAGWWCRRAGRGWWLRAWRAAGCVWWAAVVVGLVCGTAGDGWAQGATEAAVRGRVNGPTGGAIGGAEVRLWLADVDPEQGGAGVLSARTDAHGVFVVLGLRAGQYGAAVCLPRAARCVGPVGLAVLGGEVRETDLSVGSGAGGLSVSSPAGLDESADGVVEAAESAERRFPSGRTTKKAQVGESAALGALPVPDREWERTEAVGSGGHDATLADGGAAQEDAEDRTTVAARAAGETGSAATGLSFDGLPATQNAQTVDGMTADQAFGSGPRGASQGQSRAGSSFAQGAVQAVRVMPHTFSAQYGGAAGGVVAVTSRRAESRLHGDVFAETRQSGWAAVNPFAVVTRYNGGAVTSVLARPEDEDTQVGGAVGAPLDRLPGLPGRLRGWHAGVFGTAEVQERTEMLISSPETANFYELSPEQRSLLGNRGVSAAQTGAALGYLDSLTGEVVTQAPRVLGFGRLDVAPGVRDRVNVSANVQRATSPATGGGGLSEGVTDQAVSSIASGVTQVEAYTAGWEHLFPARAANSVRVQFAHDLQYETAGLPSAAGPGSAAGGGISPGGYAPQVAIEPEGFLYGTPATLGRVAYPDEQRFEVAEHLALRLRRHVLTMGGDWSRVWDEVASTTDVEGAFNYDSGTTGGYDGGLVDWITDYTFNVHAYPNGGCPHIYSAVHDFCFRSYAQSFAGEPTEFVTHQVAGFAEDSVRLGRGLLVTLGARYDYQLLPFPQAPNAPLDAVLRQLNSPGAGVTATFPEDRNNFGPRAAVAWSPGGLRGSGRRWLTVQAGYGFFYGRLPGATIDAALTDTAMPSSTTRIRILPTTEVDCPQVANQGFGYPCAFEAVPTGVAAQTSSAMVFSDRFRLPATQRGMFGVEREFGRRLMVRGEYATAWTTQLPETTDINIAPSTSVAQYVIQGGDGRPGLHTGATFVVPAYTQRLTTKYGPVTAIESNANATYHAGTAEVRLRNFHGWGVRGSYTYARAIDYGPQSGASPRANGQFDPFSDGYDKGLSSLDFAQHFSGDLTYRSEMREGAPAALRAMLSGWQLSAVGTAGSGAPYSYGVFGGTRLTGGQESINGSGGATYLPTVGRNTLRLPPRGVANVRLGRELPVRGRMRLRVQADAFNVMNAVSLSRVETRAFVLGTAPVGGGPIPLTFQDGATVLSEGVTTPPFGTPLSSTSGGSRERQVQVGARLSF